MLIAHALSRLEHKSATSSRSRADHVMNSWPVTAKCNVTMAQKTGGINVESRTPMDEIMLLKPAGWRYEGSYYSRL